MKVKPESEAENSQKSEVVTSYNKVYWLDDKVLGQRQHADTSGTGDRQKIEIPRSSLIFIWNSEITRSSLRFIWKS